MARFEIARELGCRIIEREDGDEWRLKNGRSARGAEWVFILDAMSDYREGAKDEMSDRSDPKKRWILGSIGSTTSGHPIRHGPGRNDRLPAASSARRWGR